MFAQNVLIIIITVAVFTLRPLGLLANIELVPRLHDRANIEQTSSRPDGTLPLAQM